MPRLFSGLLDDAALFPPGNAPMGLALEQHAHTLRSPDAAFVGTFVCGSSRLPELLAELPAQVAQLDLSLVCVGGPKALPAALDLVAGSRRLRLRAVELAAPEGTVEAGVESLVALLPPRVTGYVEPAPGPSYAASVRAVAGAGLRVKLRSGGPDAGAFPSEQSLAECMAACLEADVAFKLTAGLHHAVRHRDPQTGFEHHGFLNVLAAAGQPSRQASQLAEVLAERSGAALAERIASLSAESVVQTRRRFVSFGTCSTSDPLADLRALRLVPQELR